MGPYVIYLYVYLNKIFNYELLSNKTTIPLIAFLGIIPFDWGGIPIADLATML